MPDRSATAIRLAASDITRYERMMRKVALGQTIYIENTHEGMAFRWVPGLVKNFSRVYAKRGGMPETQINVSSNYFTDALLEAREMTESEYNKY